MRNKWETNEKQMSKRTLAGSGVLIGKIIEKNPEIKKGG
jgi:hypothetical protein